jgi:hypothetical protein
MPYFDVMPYDSALFSCIYLFGIFSITVAFILDAPGVFTFCCIC